MVMVLGWVGRMVVMVGRPRLVMEVLVVLLVVVDWGVVLPCTGCHQVRLECLLVGILKVGITTCHRHPLLIQVSITRQPEHPPCLGFLCTRMFLLIIEVYDSLLAQMHFVVLVIA